MERSKRIHAALTEAFEPIELNVIDDSASHAGHAGARPSGETHYEVSIVAPAFKGMSRVQVQRAVMLVLTSEFDTGLHALSIRASAPPD